MQLALPILQDRMDARSLEHKAELAKLAESEIIRMEVGEVPHIVSPLGCGDRLFLENCRYSHKRFRG